MCDKSQEQVKDKLDDLADRIKQGIAVKGYHVIDEDDLALLCDHHDSEVDDEGRMHVENFAAFHGFAVYLSTCLPMAIFGKKHERSDMQPL